ncbi:GlxA family transcriptional regulator [Phytoactinopolyspora mesophila]|uniref:GlxA family transcriptional regulator n=1 Tax=Phytoactinopolyspora mesophila TaxID=2650750 RepID=UPI001C9E585D
MAPRLIVLAGFPGVQGLDLTGPMDTFAGAHELVERTGRDDPGYQVMVASPDGRPFRTRAGLSVLPDCSLATVPVHVDTLIVPGGDTDEVMLRSDVTGWLRERAPGVRRVASVCTGAFLLAEAGLLNGRRATTHWSQCERLSRRYPQIDVDAAPIYVRDGNRYTSAGVCSGIDLALALVEEDLGRAAALTVARWLVMFLRRPGNQAQFSVQMSAQLADREPIREVQHWISDNLGADLSVPALAARAHSSPRHFARSFQQQVGVPPGQYVQQVRLEAARRHLEESDSSVEHIAAACGFGSTETMRRAFVDALGAAPAEYRRRFRPAASPTPAISDDAAP